MPNYQKSTILNLGAGQKIIEGAINLDIKNGEKIDTVCDIRDGLPFDDESMTEVIADYVLCQVCEPEKFRFVLNEIWRVLKPNGWLKLRVPDARFPAAFQDPMDCRRFVKETFDYFNKDHYRFKAFNYNFKPWTIVKIEQEREDRLYVEMRKSLRV